MGCLSFGLIVLSTCPIFRFKVAKNIFSKIRDFWKDLMDLLVDKIFVTNVLGMYLILNHLSSFNNLW